MKLKDAFIYVVGTISVLLIGLIIVGGVAFFMVNRIEFATANHAQRETERIAEVGEEPKTSKREIYADAEFIIENVEMDDDANNGVIEWRTTEGTNGEYQSGVIEFYITFHGDVAIRRRVSEYPQFVSYTEEMNEAIEGAIQND
ncbi:hypothetical protein GCM10008929_16850 [Alkalibacterium psychrotolerans]